MNKDNTIILAICGKGASGKDTLVSNLFLFFSGMFTVKQVISDTTRKPRINEKDGIDYNFFTKEKFKERINTGHYIEYAKFKGQYYGTPFTDIKFGAINIMIVNPRGLKTLKEFRDRFTIIPIYITIPLGERLKRFIKREGHFKLEYIRRIIVDFFNFLNIEKVLKPYCSIHLATESTERINKSWANLNNS